MKAVPGSPLEITAECLSEALSGHLVIQNSFLALAKAMALLQSPDASWRVEQARLLAEIAKRANEVTPMLADELGDRISRDLVLLGLESFALLIGNPRLADAEDRLAFARILMSSLAIDLDMTGLAERDALPFEMRNAHTEFARAASPTAVH